MAYRKLDNSATWHWCYDCRDWPATDFRQREDKPPTWDGQSLCEECARRDGCNSCRHSIELRTGAPEKLQQATVPHAYAH
jgi:hypothetical protein